MEQKVCSLKKKKKVAVFLPVQKMLTDLLLLMLLLAKKASWAVEGKDAWQEEVREALKVELQTEE